MSARTRHTGTRVQVFDFSEEHAPACHKSVLPNHHKSAVHTDVGIQVNLSKWVHYKYGMHK